MAEYEVRDHHGLYMGRMTRHTLGVVFDLRSEALGRMDREMADGMVWVRFHFSRGPKFGCWPWVEVREV